VSEIINLNKARKARARAAGKAQAAENRVAFGRPKQETALEKARREKAARTLDGKKLED
jgi:nucleotide-binding universal stress UspA family protein